jgi:hypothetical protein
MPMIVATDMLCSECGFRSFRGSVINGEFVVEHPTHRVIDPDPLYDSERLMFVRCPNAGKKFRFPVGMEVIEPCK